MPPMSAIERAREAVARAICTGLRHGDPDEPVTDSGHVLWELHVGAADMAISALTSLPLPDRLALLLSESERAKVAVVPRYPTVQMMVAGSEHVGEEGGDGDSLKAWTAMIAAASEAAHAGA